MMETKKENNSEELREHAATKKKNVAIVQTRKIEVSAENPVQYNKSFRNV